MVMSGGGSTDSNDPDREVEVLDWSYQNHTDGLLRGGKHCGSSFKRAILDNADLTEGDFTNCDFSKASMVGADLMKSAFDGADFRNADLRKARNCKMGGADLRGIRGRYAIWQGSDWWNAKLNEDLEKVLAKKWPRPKSE